MFQSSSLLNFSLESIDTQTDLSIVSALSMLYDRVEDMYHRTSFSSNDLKPIAKEMSDLIYERFGMRLKVELSNNILGPGFIPTAPIDTVRIENYDNVPKDYPYRDPKAPFARYFNAIKDISKRSERGFMNLEYTVDIENAKVEGLPSGLVVGILFIPIRQMIEHNNKHDFNSRHFIAIVMHEIGHAFGMLEYAGRVKRAINTLEDPMKKFKKNPKEAKKIAIKNITTIGDRNNDLERVLKKNIDNDKVFWSHYTIGIGEDLLNTIERVESLRADGEILADKFASRFGLSKELVEALDSLDTTNLYDIFMNFIYLFYNILIIGVLASLCLLMPVLIPSVLARAFILFGIIWTIIRLTFSPRYLNKVDRTETIIRDFLAQISKAEDMDRDNRKRIIDTYNAMLKIHKSQKRWVIMSNLTTGVRFIVEGGLSGYKGKYRTALANDKLMQFLAANELKIQSLILQDKIETSKAASS